VVFFSTPHPVQALTKGKKKSSVFGVTCQPTANRQADPPVRLIPMRQDSAFSSSNTPAVAPLLSRRTMHIDDF
jgi:hypothetical protein